MSKLEMTELDKAFASVLLWKAKKVVDVDYQEQVGILQPADRFKVGAIDAMVFDLALLLGFTKKTKEHLYSRVNMLIIFRKATR